MAKEIEYRFLCNDFVKSIINIQSGAFISHGYLHVDKHQQIRVRLYSDKSHGFVDTSQLCIKHMLADGLERDEFEYQIPYEDGKQMYDKCQHKFLKKRYKDKTLEGFHIDIDEYCDGTFIAEVELPSKETRFTKPIYFGENITGVHKYCNYAFAGIDAKDYE